MSDVRISEFSHLNSQGEVAMVNVAHKPPMLRTASAIAEIRMSNETIRRIESFEIAKGNVFACARIAGIMAAKRTGELIPLCHPIGLDHCDLAFEIPPERDRIVIRSTTTVTASTGVEMEALTAATVAALTIYDMCKAVDKHMAISNVKLLSKVKQPVVRG